MMTELNSLKIEVSNLEEPSTIAEFSHCLKLNTLAEKIDITLQHIYPTDPPIGLNKENIIKLFEPKNGVYIKDGIKPYQKYWRVGKVELLNKINNCIEGLELKQKYYPQNAYVNIPLISELENLNNENFDTKKLVQFLKEVNSTFKEENYLACILLLRAILNYIPPIFGQTTFAQVTSQVGKSLKDNFSHLEDGLRRVADLHTHKTISNSEHLPTHRSIDVYKPQFEILIQGVIAKLK